MTEEPKVTAPEDLTYGTYLKVEELLELQIPQSSPPHHDEMLFIVIHQAYELWFKLMLHELDMAIHYMNEKKVLRARHFVERTVEIMKLLVRQIHILETMTPVEFCQFRYRLKPASGFQSVQFRAIEFICGLKDERYLGFFKNSPDVADKLRERIEADDLRVTYYEMLGSLGYDVPVGNELAAVLANTETENESILDALLPVYADPEQNLPLYLLTESLVSLDQQLAHWREHHVRVVERIIGFKKGTGGSSGAAYLRSTVGKKCFPYLWDIRSRLEDI